MAYKDVSKTQTSLSMTRTNVEQIQKEWWADVVEMATERGTRQEIPRRKGDKPAVSPEVHFRQTITIPLLDELDGQMTRRFSRLQQIAAKGMHLIPSIFMDDIPTAKAACRDFARQHESDLPDSCDLDVFMAELDHWEAVLAELDPDNLPTQPAEALKLASGMRLFRGLQSMLQLLCTWPVSTCECERCVSALGRLKTYLRSTTSQDRLSSLALLHVHYAMQLDHEEVIRVFRCKKNRRVIL